MRNEWHKMKQRFVEGNKMKHEIRAERESVGDSASGGWVVWDEGVET